MTRAKTQRPKSRGGSRAGTNARKGTEGAYEQMVTELADELDENEVEVDEPLELPRKRASEPRVSAPAPAPPKPKVPFPDRNRPPTGPAPRSDASVAKPMPRSEASVAKPIPPRSEASVARSMPPPPRSEASPRTAPPGPPPGTPRPAPRTVPPGPPPGADRSKPVTLPPPIVAPPVAPVPQLLEPVRTRPPTPPPLIPPPDYDDESADIAVEPPEVDEPEHEDDIEVAPLIEPPRPVPSAPPARRSISVGDSADEDLVVESEELPEIPQLAIGIYDTGPQAQAAQRAIEATGHLVGALGTSDNDIELVREAIREGDVDAILVGLPGGEPLIDAALALSPRRPVVIAACTGDPNEAVGRAAAAGADLVTIRPYTLERIAPILLAAARLVDDRSAATTARGSEAVLRARLDAIAEPEPGSLQPFELFQRVLELEIKRAKRYQYPIAVALFAVDIPPPAPPPGVRGILRARAGNALVHAIRDIDLATEVDHERFLVLLPYTDLSGAAEVARRIIAAVAANDAVVAAGRAFPPKLVGAVACGTPGQPVSFARLMKEATKALEQARRDGAELAVPI